MRDQRRDARRSGLRWTLFALSATAGASWASPSAATESARAEGSVGL
jgi:hypothetical protein